MASDAVQRRTSWDVAVIDIPPDGTTIPLYFTDGFARVARHPDGRSPDELRFGVGTSALPDVTVVGDLVMTEVTFYSEGESS